MIIKTENIKIKITKNSNNRFWAPIGKFWNITEVLINDEWYKCGLRYLKKDRKYHVQIYHPMKVDEKTCIIKEVFCEGVYREVKTSRLKFNLLMYLENSHRLNDVSYKLRKGVFDRRQTILIFSFATILSLVFYFINHQYNNVLIHLLAENTVVQTFFFFLTISGFISIFQPFSIRKELSEADIKIIIKEDRENEKRNEEIKERANL